MELDEVLSDMVWEIAFDISSSLPWLESYTFRKEFRSKENPGRIVWRFLADELKRLPERSEVVETVTEAIESLAQGRIPAPVPWDGDCKTWSDGAASNAINAHLFSGWACDDATIGDKAEQAKGAANAARLAAMLAGGAIDGPNEIPSARRQAAALLALLA
jgi:hypothetical protein